MPFSLTSVDTTVDGLSVNDMQSVSCTQLFMSEQLLVAGPRSQHGPQDHGPQGAQAARWDQLVGVCENHPKLKEIIAYHVSADFFRF